MADATALETLVTLKQIRDMLATLLEKLGTGASTAPAAIPIKGEAPPPTTDCHTLQFEGQLDPDGNPIVAAVVLNPAGKIVVEFGRRIEKGKDAVETEAYALWCGMSLVSNLGLSNLLIETRSKSLFDQVTSPWQTNDSRLADTISRIRTCADESFSYVAVLHKVDEPGRLSNIMKELLAGQDYIYRM